LAGTTSLGILPGGAFNPGELEMRNEASKHRRTRGRFRGAIG
jgi:hypothetical protein